MTTLEPGSVFAGYTVERRLGAGGMGEVYLARHPRLDRRDALKILAAHLADDADFRTRFEREASVVAGLSHPNIVTVHDRGLADDRLWIAYEFIDGADLATVAARGPLPLPQVAAILVEVASALDAAAGRGLVHRDVKPANVLLDPAGHAHLTDFGIAHADGTAAQLTAVGATIGTIAYASPEQLRAQAVDPRSDQYSLACTAVTLLTGAPPFPGGSPTAVTLAHIRQAPPTVSQRRPDLPPGVDAVLQRALAKDPADRYPSSSAFAADLAAALDGTVVAPAPMPRQPVPPSPHQPVHAAPFPTPPDPAASQRTGRLVLYAGIAVAVVAAVVAAAVLISGGGDRGVDDDKQEYIAAHAPVELSPAAADLPRRTVSLDLPSLESQPRRALWTVSSNDTSVRVIGGTEKYALAADIGSGRASLIVLDAETGRELRRVGIPTPERPVPRECQAFPTRQVLFCMLNDGQEDTVVGTVDLASGKVTPFAVGARVDRWTMNGDVALVSSAGRVTAIDSSGDRRWSASLGTYNNFTFINGSPVVGTEEGGVFAVRAASDGEVLYRSDKEEVAWAPFADGFLISDGPTFSPAAPTTIFNARGKQTATVDDMGALRVWEPSTVSPLPILSSRGKVAAVDPATGKPLWERPIVIPTLAGGFGSMVGITADTSDATRPPGRADDHGYWFDVYTGVGGQYSLFDATFLGTDGKRVAVTTGHGRQITVFAPDGRKLWELSATAGAKFPEYYAFGGKIYQGARRIL